MAFSNIFLDETVVICYDAVATVVTKDYITCAGARNALSVGIISITHFPGICKYFFFGRSEAQDGRRKEDKKEVTLKKDDFRCRPRPIFPARRQASIVGTAELNYRVRNGNGWTLCVKETY